MKIRQARLGMSVTIGTQTEVFFDANRNRAVMTFDKGLLTIQVRPKADSSAVKSVIIPANNVAFMIPYEDGEETYEFAKLPEKK